MPRAGDSVKLRAPRPGRWWRWSAGVAGVVGLALLAARALTSQPAQDSSCLLPLGPREQLPARDFAALVQNLSRDAPGAFFAENSISNEISYLETAADLRRGATPGGVYLGVGPEQNFSFMAQVRPALAFIIDVRRDNLLLHLMYKCLFDEAESRVHFLALLFGRRYTAHPSCQAQAELAWPDVAAEVLRFPVDLELARARRERWLARLGLEFGFDLSAEDRAQFTRLQQLFVARQFELRFADGPGASAELATPYPSFGELLGARDRWNENGSFLATEADFRFVQALQRRNRVLPVTGDFAGTATLAQIAREIETRGLKVSAFYVSNVEQYLLQPKLWQRWVANVLSLPSDDHSLFIRSYLDQGVPQPFALGNSRSTTVLQHFTRFRRSAGRYRSLWQISSDATLLE